MPTCADYGIIVSHHRKRHENRTKNVMTAMTVIMYCLSMLHLAFSFQINLVALFDQKASAPLDGVPKSVENTENVSACTPIAAETLNVMTFYHARMNTDLDYLSSVSLGTL